MKITQNISDHAKIFSVLLHRLVAFGLLLIFLAYTFSKYVIVADYYSNRQAYMQQCENKNKPWMHCNGKCQLAKKLQQQDASDKQSADQKSGSGKNPTLSSKSWFTSIAAPPQSSAVFNFLQLCLGKVMQMPKTFFHPPGSTIA